MVPNSLARQLRNALIPQSEKFTATVTLTPDATSVSLSCSGCWWKPLDIKLDNYSGIQIEGSERIINIPAEQINGPGQRREIRRRDRVTVDNVEYMVLSAGLRSVSSRWECLVREIE